MVAKDTPLFIDIAPELARVDEGITALLNDHSLWEEFLQNPVGVLAKLRVLDGVPEEGVKRANEIFYACLSNKKVISLLIEMYGDFDSDSGEEASRVYTEGLNAGRIENHPDRELEVVDDFLRHRNVVNQVCILVLKDLNERGLLQEKYTDEGLKTFADLTTKAMAERKSIKEILEIQDSNNGSLTSPLAAVVGPVAVAVAVAQAGVVATVVAAITTPDVVSYPHDLMKSAFSGQSTNGKALGLLGRLLNFSAELSMKVQGYERR